MRELDIGEAARQSGLSASTLRFHEEKGLIAATGRKGLRRVFASGVMERLALIALGRAAGFTLGEIAQMFAAEGKPRINRQMLAAKATELDQAIRKLSAVRDGLVHTAACPAPSHMGCPTFRRILRAAGSGAYEASARAVPKARRQRALRGLTGGLGASGTGSRCMRNAFPLLAGIAACSSPSHPTKSASNSTIN